MNGRLASNPSVAVAGERAMITAESAECPQVGAKANILVVDDRPDKLLIYQTVLAELGENVVTAASGEEALKWMLREEFAVVLLDVNMPTMDGFETAALIRRRKTLAHTPIIFVTAYNDDMHLARGYSLGAVDYILAPIVPDVLRTKVRVFVQLFQMTQQVRQQADNRVQLAREQAARVAAEASIRRSNFLAEASRILNSSLDFAATSRRLSEYVVTLLADFCALAVADETGRIRAIEATWVLPGGERRGLPADARINDPPITDAVARAIAAGTAADFALPSPQSALAIARPDGTEETVPLGFALQHLMVFPLVARDRTLGVFVLGHGAARSRGPAEHPLAVELAGRAAIALDNALLYSTIRQADRRKDEFLAMLAHELRNPLAPIRNAVELMRTQDPAAPAFGQLRELIAKEVRHLTHLVDDLLDVSRITRGKIALRLTDVEVHAVLATAVESTRASREARGHRLELALAPEPLWIRGDAVRLAQVAVNLLDNAAKFTPEGGVIAISTACAGSDCVIRIRDTGIGIAPELLPAVFELFVQGDRSLARTEGGLGIGLALVRDLVRLHGGAVDATSAGIGSGSEFVIRLPLARDGAPRPAPEPPGIAMDDSTAPAAGQRILVVDDHEDSAATLALLFEMHGHEVETAQCGPDALELAGRFRPHVAVLDIGLPGMDGYEVARRMRTLPGVESAVLIALSGYGQPEDEGRSRAAGFAAHLVKPVEPSRILSVIASLTDATPRADGETS